MFVIPKSGLRVLNPARNYAPISPTGEEVPNTNYWQRRVMQGDVIEGEAPGGPKE